MLHGREGELARIRTLVDGARHGRGGALVVSGEAGAGKSTLLQAARPDLADLLTLHTQGVESEAPLPFAALQRLLQPLRPLVDRLPPPQARALRVVLGEELGDGIDRFLAFLATLNLLAEAAAEQPVLAIVDDAHWLDDASAAALLFVARRLQQEPVALVFGVREGDARTIDTGDLPTLRVSRLGLSAALDLLRERTGDEVSSEVAAQLVAGTGGNPLALTELCGVLTPDQLRGRAPLPQRLPVTRTLERVFLDRARRLTRDAQRLLLVAATDDSGRIAVVLGAGAEIGLSSDALAELESSGLLQAQDDLVQLRHPLVRSAVYSAATTVERREAHAALATVLTHEEDADRRAWHRAASVDEPDASVVAELEAAAVRAEQRGGHEAASSAWVRAAELSSVPADRGQRLHRAAQAAWLAGRPARARPLADATLAAVSDPVLHSDVVRLRARIEWNTGSTRLGHRMVLEGARDVAPYDADRARELALFAAALASFGGDSGIGIDAAQFAALPERPTGRQACCAEILLSLRASADSRWAEAAQTARRAREAAAQLELGDQDLLPNLAIAAMQVGDHATAGTCHQQMLTRGRDAGAVFIVLYALTRLPWTGIPTGDWSGAALQATEAASLAEHTGQPGLLAAPLCWSLLIAAYRGDDAYDDLWSRIDPLLRSSELGTLKLLIRDVTHWARGVRASPRSAAAFHHLAQISHHTTQRLAAVDRVEAAVHADQMQTARLWAEDLQRFADCTGQPWALAAALHGRAVLAGRSGDDGTDALFDSALAVHAETDRPFDRARTQLAYGEHLRRARKRVASRDHLRAALETFEDLRAAPWSERAAQELRASGETTRKRDVSTMTDLTAQELQVAHLVRRGLTNKEVAAHLFVSPRTVDFHLRNVFAKTGVTSRVELARLALD